MLVGISIARLEDDAIFSGRTAFADALHAPAELHMHVVRSQLAHGRLIRVDIGAASRAKGVVAVFTAADTKALPPIGIRGSNDARLAPYFQPVLAREELRYVGEPVAIVLAETAALAEDAAHLVRIEAKPLDAIVDAMAPHGAFCHQQPEGSSTECDRIHMAYGDVDAAMAAATHHVEIVCEVGRQAAVPMETRGLLAVPRGDREGFELHGVAKIVHSNRDTLAAMFGLDRAKVVLREGHVGGGFGVRGELYPEDVLTCFAALQTGRPVKWLEDRSEHLVATNQARGQVLKLRAGFDNMGVIEALEAHIWADQGAYIRTAGTKVTEFTCAFLPGPYRIPAYRVEAVISLTNKTPAGTYRAPGRFESTFAMERMLDAVARHVGEDAVAVRARNLIATEQMPFRRALSPGGKPVIYDSGDYAGALAAGLGFAGHAQLRQQALQRRKAGECVGVGVAIFVEKSGGALREAAGVQLAADGIFEVVTGASSFGQGLETVLSQIAADALGIGLEHIRVRHGQSDGVSDSAGTYSARSTVMAGSAILEAATALREQVISTAATLWQVPAAGVEVGAHAIRCSEGRSMDFAELATIVAADHRLPALKLERIFSAGDLSYPYGIHIAQVRVDPSTYVATVEKYFIAYEIGRAINPQLVKGQLIGGAVQGIGAALTEEIRHDDQGQPLARSFGDYATPRAGDVPIFDVLLLEQAPSPTNPLGAKGAGEGGINAAGAALAAAVEDAFEGTLVPLRLPMTPRYLFHQHRTPEARRATDGLSSNQAAMTFRHVSAVPPQ